MRTRSVALSTLILLIPLLFSPSARADAAGACSGSRQARFGGFYQNGATGFAPEGVAAHIKVRNGVSCDKWERTVQTNPLDDPASNEKIIYTAGLISEPLPDSVGPVVSRSEALQIANSKLGFFGPELQPGDPEVNLRSVTYGFPHGSPDLIPRPAWILTWSHSVADVHGPMDLAEEQRRTIIDATTCVFVEAIDASDGEILTAVQACKAK